MKPLKSMQTSLMMLTMALPLLGCGDRTDDIQAKIGDQAAEIKTISTTFSPMDGPPTLTLLSSESGPCGRGPNESSFYAIIELGVLDNVPLETPIEVDAEDPKSPIRVAVDVGTGSCDFNEGSARKVRGTVTFTELEEWNAEGSIDLQIVGAQSECDLSHVETIEYKWSSFTAPFYNQGGCE